MPANTGPQRISRSRHRRDIRPRDWPSSGSSSAGGARVAFVARTAAAVERIANETGAYGIVGDVGRKSDIYPIALQIIGNLGGLDVLINNASSLGPTPLAPLADTECEELEQALACEPVGAVPIDQSPLRRPCRLRPGRARRGRDQHFQ